MKRTRIALSLIMTVLMLSMAVLPLTSFSDEETDGATLPASYTLVGSKDLPPISNQGSIGSCASQSSVYMMFTNAVSRYLHSIDPDIEWDPSSGNKKYIMSPKFTYQMVGPHGSGVLDLVRNSGCLTLDKCHFFESTGGAYRITDNTGNYYSDTVDWMLSGDATKQALQYRITGFEDTPILNNGAFMVDGKTSLTSSPAGKKFIEKLKTLISGGNAVACGGFSNKWQYSTISRSGDIGKRGDNCIYYAKSGETGQHVVTLVGYDDDVVCTMNGEMLKGAFLMANSWGSNWKDEGFVWVMYDAFNEVSDYPKVQTATGSDRGIPFYSVYSIDWHKDIAIGLPSLMVDIEIEVKDRDGFAVYLSRKLKDDPRANSEEYQCPMFSYGPISSGYRPEYVPMTLSGKVIDETTEAETIVLTLNYEQFLQSIPADKTFNDYEWGVRVWSVNRELVTVKSMSLCNSDGTVLYTHAMEEPVTVQAKETSKSTKIYFDYTNTQVTVPAAGVGYHFEMKEHPDFLSQDSIVGVKLIVEEGYEAPALVVSASGTAITADADGYYNIAASGLSDVTVAGVSEIQTEIPDDPGDGDGEENSDSILPIVIGAAGAVVVIIVVAVVIVVSKKKKQG